MQNGCALLLLHVMPEIGGGLKLKELYIRIKLIFRQFRMLRLPRLLVQTCR